MLFPSLLFSQDKITLDSLLVKLEYAREDSSKLEHLWSLSDYYEKLDYSKSLEYCGQALTIAEKGQDKNLIARANGHMAYGFFGIGNYDESLNYYYRALMIFEAISDEIELLKTYVNLGVINDRISNYDKALEYYFKGLNIYNEFNIQETPLDTSVKIHTLYNNIGNIYENKDEDETALQYYQKGLELALELDDDYILGVIYNNLGKINLLKLKQLDEALVYLQKSLEVREKIVDKPGMAKSYYFLCAYYLELEDYDRALLFGNKSLQLGKEVGSLETQKVASEFLFRIYKSIGEHENAMKTHELYKKISDKLMNEKTIRELTRAQMQFEFDKKEKIQLADQKRKFMMHALIISVLSLGVVIIALLYWGVKNREQKNELVRKNLEQDLDLKNRELTTNVLYLIKKNDLINDISERLLKLKSRMKEENKEPVQKIIFDLHCGIDQEVWKEFEMRFQQIHSDFYINLQEKFPDLSPGERKLAAFLRLNMTTKEIASITGQSTKSLEVARYRLRKKLGIANKEINLINFLRKL